MGICYVRLRLKAVIEKVLIFWKRAQFPIQNAYRATDKFKKLYDEWRLLTKRKNRSPNYIKNYTEFLSSVKTCLTLLTLMYLIWLYRLIGLKNYSLLIKKLIYGLDLLLTLRQMIREKEKYFSWTKKYYLYFNIENCWLINFLLLFIILCNVQTFI